MTTPLLTQNAPYSQGLEPTAAPDYWSKAEPLFARAKHGNSAKFYTTGAEFMADAAAAIRSATKFLMFVDWQMDFDVELEDRGSSSGLYPGRFSELLARQLDAHPKLEVKILLYDSVESPAYTHENEVRLHLERLNKPNERKRVQVVVQKPSTGRGWENIGFSHHQKLIVADGKVGFIGGMDITYGRWDDGNFDVVADPFRRRINDMYNPGLVRGRLLTAEEIGLTSTNLGKPLPQGSRYRPGFCEPFYMMTVMLDRIKLLWAQGRAWDEVMVFLDTIDVQSNVRQILIQKYIELRDKLARAQQIYDEYSSLKAKAAQQYRQGQVRDGMNTSRQADQMLVDLALKAIGKKIDGMVDAVKESVEARVQSLQATAADIAYYAKDPRQILEDAKAAWEEVKALPDFFEAQHALEEGCQPRMPWQDVHARIEGPAVFDLYRNIAYRWNLAYHLPENKGATALNEAWLKGMGGKPLFGPQDLRDDGAGTSVQIVRSMPAPMLKAEHALPLNAYLRRSIDEAAPKQHMASVLDAMLRSIIEAKAYIYIETQFFISKCGQSSKGEKGPASNGIAEALAARISAAVSSGSIFHVYVVLPVHPEGNLEAPAVAKQQYWILQTIKHGKNSLLRTVCAAIARKKKGSALTTISDRDIEVEMAATAWKPYITFLNLRNWGLTVLFERFPDSAGIQAGQRDLTKERGRFVITEQIYVHSKLMIVDDAVAIIGSANVNDRSLNGTGDSEIAAVIRDKVCQRNFDLGNGTPVTTRTFAKDLRIALWKKHFGFDIEPENYMRADRAKNDNGESGLPKDRALPYPHREKSPEIKSLRFDAPASPGTYKAIQGIAKANADLYERVFKHTPRDSMKLFGDVMSCWPKRLSKTGMTTDITRAAVRGGGLAFRKPLLVTTPLPNAKTIAADFGKEPPMLQPRYMTQKGVDAASIRYEEKIHNIIEASDDLAKLVGFFVAMPLDFGSAEKDRWLSGDRGYFLIAHTTMRKEEESA